MKRQALAAAALALSSLAAHASLTTLGTTGIWPPAGSTGLQDVEFNLVQANGVAVAVGAHEYVTSPTLPNDGVSTFYAPDGYNANPAGHSTYADWSFDFAWSLGLNCAGCTVWLGVDTDPTAGVNFVTQNITALQSGGTYADSWNLGMSFIGATPATGTYTPAQIGFGYNFNPNDPNSSTEFELFVENAAGTVIATSIATVDAVPEPSTWALFGVGLAAMGVMARRRKA